MVTSATSVSPCGSSILLPQTIHAGPRQPMVPFPAEPHGLSSSCSVPRSTSTFTSSRLFRSVIAMAPVNESAEAKCPVDPKTREKWLAAAKAKGQQPPPRPPIAAAAPPLDIPTARELKKAERNADLLAQLRPRILQMTQEQRNILLAQYQDLRNTDALHQSGLTRYSLDHSRWTPSIPPSPPPLHKVTTPPQPPSTLDTTREISSIPRALPTNHDRHTLNSAEAAALPANSERDTGHDRDSGNWIYPSQHMFFEAMRRKGHTPSTQDMQTIVPIHNAVNERAWSHIQAWEEAYTRSCGGPKLVSFSGDSKKVTPRAWWKGLVGYERPFDRHDWVVDRCGKRVEYVIDFYSGKQEGALDGIGPSFYLDVRPKLNSWEGVKTRTWRAVGG